MAGCGDVSECTIAPPGLDLFYTIIAHLSRSGKRLCYAYLWCLVRIAFHSKAIAVARSLGKDLKNGSLAWKGLEPLDR